MDRELHSIEQARVLLGGIARNTLYDLLRGARRHGAVAAVAQTRLGSPPARR